MTMPGMGMMGQQLTPDQALAVLVQATGHESLKLSRQEHRVVEQALQTLQVAISPPPLEEESEGDTDPDAAGPG